MPAGYWVAQSLAQVSSAQPDRQSMKELQSVSAMQPCHCAEQTSPMAQLAQASQLPRLSQALPPLVVLVLLLLVLVDVVVVVGVLVVVCVLVLVLVVLHEPPQSSPVRLSLIDSVRSVTPWAQPYPPPSNAAAAAIANSPLVLRPTLMLLSLRLRVGARVAVTPRAPLSPRCHGARASSYLARSPAPHPAVLPHTGGSARSAAGRPRARRPLPRRRRDPGLSGTVRCTASGEYSARVRLAERAESDPSPQRGSKVIR